MKNKPKIYGIAFLFFLLDQLIKIGVCSTMKYNQIIEIIPSFFRLLYVENTGAAFSILMNSTQFIILISLLFLILLNYYIIKEKTITKLQTLSLGIIIGGMLGNLIDRMIRKAVIDYLSFQFFKYEFPIFNLADMGIVLGVGILIIDMLLEKKQENK